MPFFNSLVDLTIYSRKVRFIFDSLLGAAANVIPV